MGSACLGLQVEVDGWSLGVALRDSGFGAKTGPKFEPIPWELSGFTDSSVLKNILGINWH